MSDAVAAPAPAASPKPKKKPSAPKKPATHPKYSEMAKAAIQALKERGGSSRQAILKYIMKNYTVGNEEKTVNQHLKVALRHGVKNDSLKQSKGTGAAGSFRIGEKPVAAKKSPAKKVAAPKKSPAKPKVKKVKSPAKPKAAAKKVTTTKKPKSPGKKSPAKVKKPAAAKTSSKPKVVKKKASPKKVKAAGAKKAAAKK